MAGHQTKTCQETQHELIPQIWTEPPYMSYQPSNLSSFRLSFLGLIRTRPVSAGLAQSRKTIVKIRGPYKQQYADQIYTSKRWPKAGKPKKNKTHTAVTAPQNTCTHAPTPPAVYTTEPIPAEILSITITSLCMLGQQGSTWGLGWP